jgi:hypothetical protein
VIVDATKTGASIIPPAVYGDELYYIGFGDKIWRAKIGSGKRPELVARGLDSPSVIAATPDWIVFVDGSRSTGNKGGTPNHLQALPRNTPALDEAKIADPPTKLRKVADLDHEVSGMVAHGDGAWIGLWENGLLYVDLKGGEARTLTKAWAAGVEVARDGILVSTLAGLDRAPFDGGAPTTFAAGPRALAAFDGTNAVAFKPASTKDLSGDRFAVGYDGSFTLSRKGKTCELPSSGSALSVQALLHDGVLWWAFGRDISSLQLGD